MYNEYVIAHHGVMGMKWGVRKQQYKTGRNLVRQYNKLERKKPTQMRLHKSIRKNLILDFNLKKLEKDIKSPLKINYLKPIKYKSSKIN